MNKVINFYAEGHFRTYDDTEFKSSIVLPDGSTQPSIFSISYLKSRADYRPISEVTIGELFCGAGVGSVGAKVLGLKTQYAYDNNKHAVLTYNINIEDVAEVKDLKTLPVEDIPNADIIMAGFPCQPFSFNGKGLGVDDPDKGNLGKITYEIIKNKLPKAFLLENVKGLTSKKNLPFLESLVEDLSKDYNVTWDTINCADYGVPQNRERVFIVGLRNDLEASFVFPETTHKDNPVSIRHVLSSIQVKGDYIKNHSEDCGIRNDELPFVHYLSDGQCWKDLPCEDMKRTFMKGAYFSGGGRTSYLGVIDKDKPARTILSSPKGKNSAQIIKWEGQPHRRYTVRESLRLQSVPDWFYFPDSVPLMKQYERCSGIPPVITELFLGQLKEIIENHS